MSFHNTKNCKSLTTSINLKKQETTLKSTFFNLKVISKFKELNN
jgi:hypothetical protein